MIQTKADLSQALERYETSKDIGLDFGLEGIAVLGDEPVVRRLKQVYETLPEGDLTEDARFELVFLLFQEELRQSPQAAFSALIDAILPADLNTAVLYQTLFPAVAKLPEPLKSRPLLGLLLKNPKTVSSVVSAINQLPESLQDLTAMPLFELLAEVSQPRNLASAICELPKNLHNLTAMPLFKLLAKVSEWAGKVVYAITLYLPESLQNLGAMPLFEWLAEDEGTTCIKGIAIQGLPETWKNPQDAWGVKAVYYLPAGLKNDENFRKLCGVREKGALITKQLSRLPQSLQNQESLDWFMEELPHAGEAVALLPVFQKMFNSSEAEAWAGARRMAELEEEGRSICSYCSYCSYCSFDDKGRFSFELRGPKERESFANERLTEEPRSALSELQSSDPVFTGVANMLARMDSELEQAKGEERFKLLLEREEVDKEIDKVWGSEAVFRSRFSFEEFNFPDQTIDGEVKILEEEHPFWYLLSGYLCSGELDSLEYQDVARAKRYLDCVPRESYWYQEANRILFGLHSGISELSQKVSNKSLVLADRAQLQFFGISFFGKKDFAHSVEAFPKSSELVLESSKNSPSEGAAKTEYFSVWEEGRWSVDKMPTIEEEAEEAFRESISGRSAQ